MKQHWKWVLLTAAVLGWLLDILFWRQRPGLNFALYSLLCLAGGLLVMRLDRQRIAPRSRWLVVLIVLFAVLSYVRAEPFTLFLCVLLTLSLMAVLAVTYVGGRWLRYDISDYGLNFLRLARSMITRPLAFLSGIEAQEAQRPGGRAGSSFWPVLRGVLIALPIVVVFAALLASADVVFGRELQAFLRLLQLERLPEYVFRLVYIVLAAYALTGVFLHAASQSTDEKLAAESKPLIPQFLGFVEASIVLGSVAALFCSFVIVQFQYFFGGQQNINVAGYTYSEYARRGFGELMVVAFFSVLLIMGMGAVTRRATAIQQRLFSGLGVIIVVLVSVILVSAYQRLSLYELAYGFSRVRTYVHVLLIWIGILLVGVVLLELTHRERFLAATALIASLGFGLSLALLDVDGFIVRQNVQRAVRGQALDVPYLVSLSTDADPALVEGFVLISDPTPIREAVGAALACRLHLSARQERPDWRSFSLSQWRSEAALHEVQAKLTGFRPPDAEAPPRIVTPGGVVYECVGSQE